jgi:hypothetical protein
MRSWCLKGCFGRPAPDLAIRVMDTPLLDPGFLRYFGSVEPKSFNNQGLLRGLRNIRERGGEVKPALAPNALPSHYPTQYIDHTQGACNDLRYRIPDPDNRPR